MATALHEGYRNIDCALIYKNEAEVGEGIRRSGIPREEIFITSKLWNSFHSNATESLARSLKDLGTDYLDLYVSASGTGGYAQMNCMLVYERPSRLTSHGLCYIPTKCKC